MGGWKKFGKSFALGALQVGMQQAGVSGLVPKPGAGKNLTKRGALKHVARLVAEDYDLPKPMRAKVLKAFLERLDEIEDTLDDHLTAGDFADPDDDFADPDDDSEGAGNESA